MKTKSLNSVVVFALLSLISFFAQANCQVCDSTTSYDRCSTNSACGCFPMAGANNVGVCAFLWKFCSQLVPCGPLQDCSDSDHICIHHRRCSNDPVCYPLSMMNENICPPASPVTNTTVATSTLTTTITTTTTTITTTTRKPKFSKWQPKGSNVAGNNTGGEQLNQLSSPEGIFLDKNQTVYIADYRNDRIMQWRSDRSTGNVVAGGHGRGNNTDQLSLPTDVLFDERNNSLIIADLGNKRLIRWFNQFQQEILLENISCGTLATDKYGYLYMGCFTKNEVRRWKMTEIKGKEGVLVAGGNGQGNQLNQFNGTNYIFVDDEQSVYVSDYYNHRVMKWTKDAKEGVVVAGGNRAGNYPEQLDGPQGIFVDDDGQIYVADSNNHRVMLWKKGMKQGESIIDGIDAPTPRYTVDRPTDLLLDSQGNIYVCDAGRHRVQRFKFIAS